MTIIDQINELINRGIAGIFLAIIAFAVVYYVFGRDLEKASPHQNPK